MMLSCICRLPTIFISGDRFTAEDAAQPVSENLGITSLSMPGALRISERGAIVRPLLDKELHTQACLVSRADNRSKLVSEFVRAFMRRISSVKKPPQRADSLDECLPWTVTKLG